MSRPLAPHPHPSSAPARAGCIPNLSVRLSVSTTRSTAIGITNPPLDDLLEKADSKYKLVLYSAKRARQINAYYSQLGEGLLEYVGPLVDTHVQEKPLSIALREINDDLLTCEDIDPAAEAAAAEAAAGDATE